VVSEKKLTKIGQYPSISDLYSSEIRKYAKVLSAEKLAEFTRAINLFSFDIGIGSFVYLRRIFESFINEAHQRAMKSEEWSDVDYEKKRMEEKILSLKGFLPELLVEMRALYAILSKGIHELSEADCLAHFAHVREGIEVILEEKLHKMEMVRRRQEATKRVGKIKGQI
jgi:hypothetical protein